MNMQTIGTAQPVLLVQTTQNSDGLRTRAEFGTDKEFIRYLRKQLKSKEIKPDDKKKDEKKVKTYTFPEMVFILMAISPIISMIQLGMGYALFKFVRQLALP